MDPKDRKLLELFAARVRESFPDARICAFGSRARGDARPWSDLDVCVVLDELNDDRDRKIINAAWEVGFEHDVLISTITYSRREFEEGPCAFSGLVRAVHGEGVPA